MSEIIIAGVLRAGAYSPNHVGNDAAIFHAVADQLRRRGCLVNIYTEEQFCQQEISEDIVLDMCRTPQALAKLQALEDQGRLVINSGYGIENCIREPMTRLLMGAGIPHPRSLIVDTNEEVATRIREEGYEAAWVKRGESHTQHREDISYCRHAEEVQETLHEYCLRGIRRAVINEHLVGDLVKFYGIRGSRFFYWFNPYMGPENRHISGDVTGHTYHIPFSAEELHALAEKAADVIGITIYGGDCIIGSGGTISIIDFNDWPSFAPVRREGSTAIAKEVLTLIKQHRKRHTI